MAAIRIFGRRCALATDDFLIIGFIDFILFLLWSLWSTVILISTQQQLSSCIHPELLLVWLRGTCGLFTTHLMLSALFVIFASRGSLSEPGSRHIVIKCIYLKIIVSLVDAAFAIFGTYILLIQSTCSVLGVLVKAATSFQYLQSIKRLYAVMCFIDLNCWKKEEETLLDNVRVKKSSIKLWQLRLQLLLLWITTPSNARQQALKISAKLLAVMSSENDLTASDLLAGILLYRDVSYKRHKEEISQEPNTPFISVSEKLSDDVPVPELHQFPPSNWPTWMNLQNACHFFHFTKVWSNVNHSGGCGNLMSRLKCCFPSLSSTTRDGAQYNVLRDTATLLNVAYKDLVTVDIQNGVYECPFLVCFDHEERSVVISIRGTMSADDILTDVSADYEVLEGCDAGMLCHGGILKATHSMLQKIKGAQVLEQAFLAMPDYTLMLTGHSLGAAVASMSTVLLRHTYPSLRCYAFSPPPTIDAALLPAVRELIFVVTYGNDAAPSICFETVRVVLKQVVSCVNRCPAHKYQVFKNSQKVIERDDWINDPQWNEDVNEGIASSDEKIASTRIFVCGNMVHVRRSPHGIKLRIISPLDYTSIRFRPHMVQDHYQDVIMEALQELGQTPIIFGIHLEKSTSGEEE